MIQKASAIDTRTTHRRRLKKANKAAAADSQKPTPDLERPKQRTTARNSQTPKIQQPTNQTLDVRLLFFPTSLSIPESSVALPSSSIQALLTPLSTFGLPNSTSTSVATTFATSAFLMLGLPIPASLRHSTTTLYKAPDL